MRTLAILGGGGQGRVVADCAEALGWQVSIFDDRQASAVGPWTVSGTGVDLLARLDQFEGVVVGIGANVTRLDWLRRLTAAGARPATLIHPAAAVSPHTQIGPGSVVLAAVVLNIGARIGAAVILNSACTVDHDCDLGDGVHISPGAHLAGGVTVGEGGWIGIGAAVREGMTIGAGAMVGAGAVVVKPVPAGLTVIGAPARVLKRS